MSEHITREEFFHAIDGLSKGIGGVHERLDALNGRTRKIEMSTAIQWAMWVLVGGLLTIVGTGVVEHVLSSSIR